MKKVLCSLSVVILATASASPCLAADSPWNGTWKLNEAKSKLTGNTFTYTAKPTGGYHYSNGSSLEYDFACDGKDYPTLANRTVACTASGDSVFDTTVKVDGKPYSMIHRVISPDGKSMTTTATGKQPDGTPFTDKTTSIRITGSKGLAGEWKTAKTSSNTSDIVIIKAQSDWQHVEGPGFKETMDYKLDGSDAKLSGPLMPTGASMGVTAEGPRKVLFSEKLNGKLFGEGTRTLSADGKYYTEEVWSAGKKSEKEVLIYEKQ
ncbi:hypothetical protein [Granulicella sibirica]|uniref:Lipocalin-like domain-containing protein n=1 Tax=Granulicella sibirica TaxID=2479048 RepID=A0A4V1L5K6_9BACT|nr:hypothetical protein [Granulicella sibirica]RXH56094.1 hypothetical protein GRAN_2951 [Granulicella sibirica]